MRARRSARLRVEARFFFEPLELGGQFADLGIELRQRVLVFLRFLSEFGAFREQMRKVFERLPLPAVELAGMDAVVGRDLRHRFFFFEHL